MEFSVRENSRYAVACLTSMGVRLTPEGRMPSHLADRFVMQATSAETNALNVTASLGRECLALTKFVEGSPVAAFIRAQLRARNISFEGPSVPQDGPWGMRHQINIADSGFGLRAPRVWNDRAGEVGRTLFAEDYDLERIFGEEGVGILHLTGLVAAMSEENVLACLALADAARAHGTAVSFDLNYRPTFWAGREKELSEAFRELAAKADILLGGEASFRFCLGIEAPEEADPGVRAEAVLSRAQAAYPGVILCAVTTRGGLSANEDLWGASLRAGGRTYTEAPRRVEVLDRIGGGDAFAGGVLYGVLNGWGPERMLQFGWACGALAVGSLHDYAEPADEAQVWGVYGGNAEVLR